MTRYSGELLLVVYSSLSTRTAGCMKITPAALVLRKEIDWAVCVPDLMMAMPLDDPGHR